MADLLCFVFYLTPFLLTPVDADSCDIDRFCEGGREGEREGRKPRRLL